MDHFAGLDDSVKETTSEQTCRMVAFEPVAAIAAIRRTERYGTWADALTPP
jgi:hypothetical protein